VNNDQDALAPWERDLFAAINRQPSAVSNDLTTDHCPPTAVVMGVGNRDRGDDGVGSVVAAELLDQPSVVSSQSSAIIAVLDCGVAPENYLARAASLRPRRVIFIDAADFGAAPGSIALFEISAEQSATTHYSLLTTHCSLPTAVSTHSGGLDLSAKYLREACRSFDGAEDKPVCELTCRLLAVQPGNVRDGRTLTPAVREAADAIVSSEVWHRAART